MTTRDLPYCHSKAVSSLSNLHLVILLLIQSFLHGTLMEEIAVYGMVLNATTTPAMIGLYLSSSYLFASINSTSQLFNLSHLRTLNLADNDFNFSHSPTSIGHFSRLIYLNLSTSAFSGKILFEILHLSKLSSLDLTFNTDPFSGKKLLKLNKPDLRSLVT